MKAYIFPGQGSQFPGMGQSLAMENRKAAEIFAIADHVLGFSISNVMFEGSEEELRQTRITQPAIFIHSLATVKSLDKAFEPAMVAGHSLGEFSALAAAGAVDFADALRLVHQRAKAMQKACEVNPSTMAAILGLEDETVEAICSEINGVVVPANYNSPGQLVISGSKGAVEEACEKLKEAGAKRAVLLNVGGAFHSPLMEPAREKLAKAIDATRFRKPLCPVYQNTDAASYTDPEKIKANLTAQLTSPVRWTQTVQNMLKDGALEFIELGPGKVLQTLVKKIDRKAVVSGVES